MTINATNTNYNSNLGISNNNLQNTAKEIPTTAQDFVQNFAKDKQEAVKEILGYGVDSEGFFTSDFNEAAGITKDYKIEADKIKKRIESQTNNTATNWLNSHTEIDIAKTIGNIYNEFANFLNNETSAKYSSNKFDNDRNNAINNILQNKNLSKGEKIERILNDDIGIGKHFIEGQSTIIGKISGFDKNISKEELQQFHSFMDNNKIQFMVDMNQDEHGWSMVTDSLLAAVTAKGISNHTKNKELINMAGEIYTDYQALLERNDLSLEGFKQEYLKIKERYDDFAEKFKNMPEEDRIYPQEDAETAKTLESQSDSKSKFKPIQVTSKSETYQEADFLKTINFIQSQQKLEQIMLLFNQKSNNETLDIKSFEKFFKKRKLDIEI
ncbi:hypothetical protein LS70_009645 [Helicobacter sp. MIT 11-5569]|uniref:Cj0814 family flagellar-dependent secreted protein n=1 Tax=Helicobacter sp. MIT 11-5569 TaxID=1548151 RepID=UPI0010FEB5C5|nr:hypothetical protein [Helicobacter sp. MIT 11-5569]TLD79745.1 hypothetical protein LS70_009645 [Helicobacter sp. MIT 11-5569]